MHNYNFFETMKLEKNEVLNLDFHLSRIQNTFLYLKNKTNLEKNISIIDIKDFINIKTKNLDFARVRLDFIISEYNIRLKILISPLYKTLDIYKLYLLEKPIIDSKCTDFNYKFSYIQKKYKKHLDNIKRPYDDIIFLNEKNNVCETSKANIYILKNNKIITPPSSCGILKGTYRSYLISKKIIKIDNQELEIKKDIINVSDLKTNTIYISNAIIGFQKASLNNILS